MLGETDPCAKRPTKDANLINEVRNNRILKGMIQSIYRPSYQRYTFLILILPLFLACKESIPTDPQQLVDKAIQAHGGKIYDQSRIEFDFRNRHYSRKRIGGEYWFSREWNDTLGVIRDELSNMGFKRHVNNEAVTVSEEWASKYSNSINSVIYFFLLPYRLNDSAVNKEYLGIQKFGDREYSLVQVSFQEEGGGKDFEDVFVYWINNSSFEIDFLAYSYSTDGGGIRFREAMNKKRIGGILFQDYKNYKAQPEDGFELKSLFNKYEKGQLPLLSEIIHENITVEAI